MTDPLEQQTAALPDTGAQAPKSAELLALAARCEAATGADRALDCLIYEAFRADRTPEMRGMYYGETTGEYFRDGDVVAQAPAYTASLDAALALVAEKLPGALYEIKALPARRGHGASLWSDDPAVDRMLARADAATPALALMAALLRALAQSPAEGSGR